MAGCRKQVTAHASWALTVLPVFVFCPCISEVISRWPQQPCAMTEVRHWHWAAAQRPGPSPQGTARILRQTELVPGPGRTSVDTNQGSW